MTLGFEQEVLKGRKQNGQEIFQKVFSVPTIGKIQIKITLRFHLTPVIMPKIQENNQH